MNLIAHVLVSYIIGSHYASDPGLILVAVLFGILPDFDHIPHLKRAFTSGKFGPESRSVFHELLGLSLVSTVVAGLSLFVPVEVALYPLLSHYLMDFLTRPTRPFYPVNKTVIDLGIYPRSYMGMAAADVAVTGVLFLWLIL